ncbi:MAG: methyltransferase domain-containing protein [Actinomycetota bacterium]|nr:methyltransferase domain-containing protein [Actinomycetota bacterium]
MSTPSNPFDVGQETATNYANARPYYHPRALRAALEPAGRVSASAVGVDVGCGTGLSTRALAEIVGRVVGLDPSPHMLAAASAAAGVRFAVAKAEALPLRDGVADVITCAASMHWFGPAAFDELARVAAPRAVLAVYSDFFTGEVGGLPAFGTWLETVYLPRLPTPQRREHYNDELLARAGFKLVAESEAQYEVLMTRLRLRRYLMTQSNATMAVQAGQSDAELSGWVDAELAPLLGDGEWPVNFAYRTWTATRMSH